MSNVAVFYGSSTGNTESVAKKIATRLNADVFDVSNKPFDKINNYKNLILGTSSWGVEDLQDDWADFLPALEKADLSDKVVALFGLGDCNGFSDSFVDGIGILYQIIKNKGCTIIGFTSTETFSFDNSAAVEDGHFVGLALDTENYSGLADKQINDWTEGLKINFQN